MHSADRGPKLKARSPSPPAFRPKAEAVPGAGAAPSAPDAAAPQPGSPENVFYYDHELKMWRERGVAPPPPPQVRCEWGWAVE